MELPNNGHSKEGRFTLNLVGLSLFCTQDGRLPTIHEIYPGNIQDAPLFRDDLKLIFKRLKNIGIKNKELCLIFDKGNIFLEAFDQINDLGIYLFVQSVPARKKIFSSYRQINLPLKRFLTEKKSACMNLNIKNTDKIIDFLRCIIRIKESGRKTILKKSLKNDW